MKFLKLILLVFLYPDSSRADEEGYELKAKHDYRVVYQTQIEGAQAKVLVHEGGHVVGQPFQVELRAQCPGQSADIVSLPVKDSFSVCDVDPSSIKMNKQKTALAMKVKQADLKTYYDQISDGKKEPELKCSEKTFIKKFSLRNLCNLQ